MITKIREVADALEDDDLEWQPLYVHAGLDNAPLILCFKVQLAQQRECDELLRQIAAAVDFDLACLMAGIDPHIRGNA